MQNEAWDKLWRDKESQLIWSQPDSDVRALIPALKAEELKRVLDLGCGIGRHTVLFAAEGFDVHALDPSTYAVEHCRQWLQAEGLTASVIDSDMRSLDYSDGFFDFVLSWNVIYHGARAETVAALAEIRRITRDGGLAYLTFNSIKNEHFGKGVEIEPCTFDDPERDRGHHVHHYSDEKDVRDLLSEWRIETLKHEEESLTGKLYPGTWHWMTLVRKSSRI